MPLSSPLQSPGWAAPGCLDGPEGPPSHRCRGLDLLPLPSPRNRSARGQVCFITTNLLRKQNQAAKGTERRDGSSPYPVTGLQPGESSKERLGPPRPHSRAQPSGAMAGLIPLTTGLSLLQSAASFWHNLGPQGGHSVLPCSGQSGQAVGSRGNSPTGPSRFIPDST